MDDLTQLQAVAAQSWLATSDAVMRGLNHEFSNRLSLARLAPQLSAMIAGGEPELRKLADESGSSEEMLNLLRLYRLMVFGNNEPAEPLIVADVVPDAVELFKHHTTFRDLDVRAPVDTTVPPVLINRASLTQGVLLLLGAAARQLELAPGDTGVLELACTADADAVRISAQVTEGVERKTPADAPELAALRYLIRDVEGAADMTNRGATMSIGTLVRLRRREKQG